MNTALIADYLAMVHLTPRPTDDQTRRMNAVALQLAMELPDEVLGAVIRGVAEPTWQGAWDVVDAVRKAEKLDVRDREHAVFHALGSGVKK